MSHTPPDWRATYAPLLGRTLVGAALMPIACDTSSVVEALEKPVIGYSGATLLAFEGAQDLHLTWEQYGDAFGLMPVREIADRWKRFSLDTIMISGVGGWDRLIGSTLRRVELFGIDDLPSEIVIGAAHTVHSGDGEDVLWVCTAYGNEEGPGDDLLVSLNTRSTDWPFISRMVIQ